MFWADDTDSSRDDCISETASLETDVFRFLAIIGFCLLAIFTLVQAIPVTGPETRPIIEDFGQKFQEQHARLKELQAENQRLGVQTERLLQETALADDSRRDAQRVREEVQSQRQQIERLITEKVERERDLVAYKKQIEIRDRQIRQLEDEKRRTESKVEKTQQAAKSPKSAPLKQEASSAAAPRPASSKGLYVAFESDRVFMDLLKSNKISLYIRVVDLEKGFEAVPRNGRTDFESRMPASGIDLWEIREDVIPAEIVRDFKAWTTLGSQKKMYIVGLTQQISSQVRSKAGASGRIIIRANGQVVYTP